MKYCSKCKKYKEINEFNKDKQKVDGVYSYCKACTRKRNLENSKKNPEYYKEYAKKYREKNREILREKSRKLFLSDKEKYLKKGRESYYRHKDEIAKKRKLKRLTPEGREKSRIRQAVWRSKNKEKFNKTIRKWQINNREKTNAHAKVHRAIANGRLVRSMNCEECGKKCKTEGHHEDYSKPLDVIWLCKICHSKKIEKVEV